MISSRDGAPNLYIIPVNGGEARRLTNISTGIADPLWSPDSKSIAFSTDVYPDCGDDDACNQKARDAWSNGPLKAHVAIVCCIAIGPIGRTALAPTSFS